MEASNEQVMDFGDGYDYDADALPINCRAGGYEAVIDGIKIDKDKNNFPRICINWVMQTALDPENESSVGATVTDRIVFWPESVNTQTSRIHKSQLQLLLQKLDINRSVVPKKIRNSDSFAELVSALQGQRGTVYVKHSPSKDDPNTVFENINYRAPKGSGGEEEAEAAPAAPAPKPKVNGTNGTNGGTKKLKQK